MIDDTYLEHYDTGKDRKRCEHDIINRGHNCSVECIKCLKHQNILQWKIFTEKLERSVSINSYPRLI